MVVRSETVAPLRPSADEWGPTVEALEHSRYFLTHWLPALLRQRAAQDPPTILADLGAGDGGIFWAMDVAGLVGETVYAVDISAKRVSLCERLSPKVRGIVSDVADIAALPDESVDAVVSSQVIEHLPDDRVLVPEIARILRPGGWFYVASVMRGPRAFWMYKGKAPAPERWQLDPTHMREYASENEFRSVLEHPEVVIDSVRSSQLRFPLTDFALRMAAAAHLLRRDALPEFYLGLPRWAERIRMWSGLPIPGYRWVEAVGHKRPVSL
jgi:SAM-dependent methyltransferase